MTSKCWVVALGSIVVIAGCASTRMDEGARPTHDPSMERLSGAPQQQQMSATTSPAWRDRFATKSLGSTDATMATAPQGPTNDVAQTPSNATNGPASVTGTMPNYPPNAIGGGPAAEPPHGPTDTASGTTPRDVGTMGTNNGFGSTTPSSKIDSK